MRGPAEIRAPLRLWFRLTPFRAQRPRRLLRTARGLVSGGETLVGWLIIVIVILVIIGAVTVVRKVL
jgi:hypothetical protein